MTPARRDPLHGNEAADGPASGPFFGLSIMSIQKPKERRIHSEPPEEEERILFAGAPLRQLSAGGDDTGGPRQERTTANGEAYDLAGGVGPEPGGTQSSPVTGEARSDSRHARRFRGRFAILSLAGFLVLSIGIGLLWDGKPETWPYRIPVLRDLFRKDVISLKPFIIPARSPGRTYTIYAVDAGIERERSAEALQHLPHIRNLIYAHLVGGAGYPEQSKIDVERMVGHINSDIGSPVIYKLWIKEERSL